MQNNIQNFIKSCQLCPIMCGTDRWEDQKGICHAGKQVKAAKAFLHLWEEPCISGEKGSGTIFFSGCNMQCVFCQNHQISQGDPMNRISVLGKEISIERLSHIFLSLQAQGAHNINLVSPTPYILHIIEAVAAAKAEGLGIPIIYNSNGYERPESVAILKDTVDIYLPDLKYFDNQLSMKYSNTKNYFKVAANAIMAMVDQVGYPVFDADGMMKKGVLIRHLMLPGMMSDTKNILDWIKSNLGSQMFISLMCQYTPLYRAFSFPEINKTLTEREYEEVIDYFFEIGLENGFVQELNAASDDFVPKFDLSGI